MASILRSLSTVFAVGMIGGTGVLMLLPPAADATRTAVASAPIPTPAALPCKKQTWPNSDRGCQKWTAPPRQVAKAEPVRDSGLERASLPPVNNRQAAAAVRELDQREQIPPHAQPHLAANAPPPSLVTEEARSAVASDGQATPPPRNPRSEARGRHEPSRNTRSAGDSIAVTATGSDGKRRTIMIRPTSQQDIYYYAARRELPASSVGRP